MNGAAAQQVDPRVLNYNARQLILNTAIDLWLPIAQGTITTGVGSQINIPGRNLGLVKRFMIKLIAPVTPSAQNQTLGPMGPAALLSNVTLTDLNGQVRVNTPGWHLQAIATAKRRRVFGAAATSDTPFGYGNNFTSVMAAPATLTGGAGASNVFATFEVPVSYSDTDLRGGIWASITNATFNLQFTLNPNMFAVAAAADATQALYQSAGAAAATIGTVQYIIYQNCLDQIPFDGQGNRILPYQDIGTAYTLLNTPLGGIVANQDNPFPYPNFRDIMSTVVIYNNAGTLNVGSDIGYWALQSANYTNIFKYDPFTSALLTRLIIGDDTPKGMYYFDHRAKPINTLQYGNMALLLNPTTVNAGASMLIGIEALALIGAITAAGSLA